MNSRIEAAEKVPAVTRDGDVVSIDDVIHLSTHAAITLAHKLADAVGDSRYSGAA